MEARLPKAVLLVLALASLGAGHRTRNFVVTADNPQLARKIGESAEQWRHSLSVHWLGRALPDWADPCPISVQVGPQVGAGGVTSFYFDQGEVFGWQMSVQGTEERVLDSVLPHEITHTIFASYFRQPLPRWIDEGACTTVEHDAERSKHEKHLQQYLRSGRGIAFNRMFAMREYPPDILPLYAQGYSLASYLIQQGGPRKFIAYVHDGLNRMTWTEAVRKHYGFNDLGNLQQRWVAWVADGSRKIDHPVESLEPNNSSGTVLASATEPATEHPMPNIAEQQEPLSDQPAKNSVAATAPQPAEKSSQTISAGPLVAIHRDDSSDLLAASTKPQPKVDKQESPPKQPSANSLAAAVPRSVKQSVRGESGWRARNPQTDIPKKEAAEQSSTPLATQVTRPQNSQGPGQIILQWSRDDAPGQPSSILPGNKKTPKTSAENIHNLTQIEGEYRPGSTNLGRLDITDPTQKTLLR